MSVLVETSAGDLVIDLLVDHAPQLCENFLKLCRAKYYNFSPIHSIQKNFSFTTGDPLGPLSTESDGGTSIRGLLSGRPADRAFPAPFHPKLKHLEPGTVSMATVPLDAADPDAPRLAASQFTVTLGPDTDFLDGKAAIFGKVVEGFDVLEKINGAIVDERGHPLVDIRIQHTIVLDDPYPDPEGFSEPSASPVPTRAQLATVRIADEEALRADDGLGEEELERRRRAREAQAQALTLEMMGDLPFAEVKPPENVLFVCKLNPVTADEDLELIFGRFGKILSCEVIRDRKTGDSLQYAFIEFEDRDACERAYAKMQDVLIDDRRIHVDFSQSVSKLSDVWRKDTNQKRKAQAGGRRGGWGGVDELEKRRQYRDEWEEHDDGYMMVHGEEGGRGRGGGSKSRSRSRSRSMSPRVDERDERDGRRGDERRGGERRGGERRGGERRGGEWRGGDRRGGERRGGDRRGGEWRGRGGGYSRDNGRDRDSRRRDDDGDTGKDRERNRDRDDRNMDRDRRQDRPRGHDRERERDRNYGGRQRGDYR